MKSFLRGFWYGCNMAGFLVGLLLLAVVAVSAFYSGYIEAGVIATGCTYLMGYGGYLTLERWR